MLSNVQFAYMKDVCYNLEIIHQYFEKEEKLKKMYLCYSDESGYCGSRFDPNQPIMVMAGIIPNIYNYHKSDAEFREIFNIINRQIPLEEIKGEQIYRGRGSWNIVRPKLRDRVIEFYLNWINKRPHKLIISAVDNKKYFEFVKNNPNSPFSKILTCPYLFSALHIALVVQKKNKAHEKNKGKTLLIFDEQHQYDDLLTDILFNPPDFIDNFISFNPKKDNSRLSQVIDTAFFVKSHHSSMAQVVDIVAFLMRLYLELKYYNSKEAYKDETQKIEAWINSIYPSFIPLNSVYPKTKLPFLNFINQIKAKGIRD